MSEQKKSKKGLIIGIIAGIVALAGLGVGAYFLFGANKGNEPAGVETEADSTGETETATETAEPEDDKPLINQLYWNVERNMYAGKSEAGTSSRAPSKEDGYYHILFAVNGRSVEYRCSDKKIVNQIDSLDLMGLVFDEKNIIVGVRRIEEFTGGFLYEGMYVSGVTEDGVVLLNSAEALNGMEFELEMPADAKIYDVSGALNQIGYVQRVADLREFDRLYVLQDKEGKVIASYIISRFVKQTVYWNVERKWDSTIQQSTRKPDEEGVYHIIMACEGEQVEILTKSDMVVYNIDKEAARVHAFRFDEEGYAVERVGVQSGGIFGSWYHITELDGSRIVAEKIVTASDTGRIVEGVLADNYECYDVSGVGEFVGVKYENLKVMDQIHCLKNTKGEVAVVFVVGHTQEGAEIYWNMNREYDSTNQRTKKTPDANGYYWFELACNGSVKRYKTNDKDLANRLDSDASRTFALFVDGDTITKKMGTVAVTGGSVIASWYNVTEKRSATNYMTKRPSTGALREINLAENCKIYNVTDNKLYDSHAGELLSQLTIGDLVHCLTNVRGEVVYVMLIRRAMGGEIYWHLSRKYDSKNAVSTRTPDAEGYYVFQFASLGKQVTLKTKSKAMADKVDSYQLCLCLEVQGDIITRAGGTTSLPKTAGGVMASYYDVTSIKGNEFTSEKIIQASDTGRVRTLKMAKNVEIYNVGTEFTIKGEKTDLRVGDRVHCLVNADNEATVIYIVNRPGKKITATCPECGKTVTWTSFNGSLESSDEVKVTTSIGGKDVECQVLHYYLAGDRTMSGQVSTPANTIIHFDMNSHTLTGAETARMFALFNQNGILKIFDLSAEKKGVIKSQKGKGPSSDSGTVEGGSAFWLRYATTQLFIKDTTIDFSAMEQPMTNGGLYATSGSTIELENVKIIAAKQLHGGAAIYSAGNLVLKNVMIEGGRSELGGSVYLTAGTITIDGNTTIQGGTLLDGSPANLSLASGIKIKTTDGITSAAGTIGVTAAGGTFTADEFEAYKDAFKSDNDGVIGVTAGKALEMVYALEAIEAAEATVTIPQGGILKLVVNPVPANASLGTLTYEVADPTKVSIDANGNVKGLQMTDEQGVKVTIKTEGGLETTVQVVVTEPAADAHYHVIGTLADINAETGEKVIFEPFDVATLTANKGGTFYMYLTDDVELTSSIVLPDTTLVLCLNGHKIRRENARVLQTSGATTNAEIKICDCSADQSGQVVGGATDQGGVLWFPTSKIPLTIYGGTFTNERAGNHYYGGAIIYAELFNMYGGVIKDGTLNYGSRTADSSYTAGGANVRATTFNMYGGEISGGTLIQDVDKSSNGSNVTALGGNVYAGTFNMYGGVIKDGRAIISDAVTTKRANGGNVRANSFNMYGGEIKNGSAVSATGNVYITGQSVISGGTISGGTSGTYGGSVFVSSSGSLTMDGGTITGGTSGSSGGNIFVTGSFTMTGGEITGGTAGTHGGNLSTEGTVILNGGTISGGTSTTYGGNVSVITNGNLTLTAGKLTNGTAGTHGGNLYVSGKGTALIEGGEISGGAAGETGNGTNVIAASGSTLTVKGGTIVADETNDTKNALYVSAGSTVTLEGGSLTRVTAESGVDAFITGGSFYVEPDAALVTTGYLVKALDTPATETVEGAEYSFKYQVISDLDVVHITMQETANAEVGTDLAVEATVNMGNVILQTAEWTSSDPAVATVAKDAGDPSKATVTPLTAGTTDITLTINGEYSAKIVVTVTVPAPLHANHCICGGTDTCLAAAADGHTALKPAENWTEVTSESELRAAITAGTVGGDVFVYLGNDITMTGTSHISTSSRKVHLCLNGYTLAAAKTARLFAIYKSDDTNNYPGTLTICDCSESETGKITAQDDATGPLGQGGLIYNSTSGTLEIYGGTIQNGRTKGNNPGGCISCRGSSTFRMYGGTIKGGQLDTTTTAFGGNVELQGSASFTMYGGLITGGTANRGGNISVYNTGTTFTMKGGEISGGKDSGNNTTAYAGNILVFGASSFTMDGGTISGGKATTYGGNVVVNASAATFTMNGGEITGGTSTTSGGNVYNAGTFTMNGGKITDGTATTHGGNVVTEKPMTMNGGEITGGKATTYGGNVSITSNGTFTLNDGLIKDGKANTYAGNVAALGTFNMKGGEIKDGEANCDKTSNNGKDSGGNMFVSKTATIEGGKFTGGKAYRGGNINVGGVGKLTISGTASIEGGESETDGALISVAGELIIEGGFFTATNTEGFAIVTYKASEDVSSRSDGVMSITISGGVFDGTGDMIGTIDGGTLTIEGGVFKKTVQILKGNGIIKDGIFGDKVAVGMTEDDEADGTLEISSGFFTVLPEEANKGRLIYGGFVPTTDATPDATKTYYVETDVQVSSKHSYYTYEAVTGLAAFEDGKSYVEILAIAGPANFEKENEFENATGTQEILKTFYRAGGMS